MPQYILPEHGLAHRYCDGYKGCEIGGSKNNPFNIPGCVNVDFTDEHTRFKQVEIDLCGEALKVDVVAEADCLPFEDSSQDYVVSSHVIEHLPDPIKALKEWVRVIRPGGIILAIIPHKGVQGSHPGDADKPITSLDHLAEDHEQGMTVETHPIPEGHEKRGHYHVFSYQSFKALIRRFFADTLEWFDGEPFDQKVGNGHAHVLRVTKPTADGSPRVDLQPTRKRVWINMPDDTGCTYYRQSLPYSQIKDELAAKGIDLYAGGGKGSSAVRSDASYDAYVCQRTTSANAIPFLHWMKRSERKLIWDLDDDFFAIPEWSPAYNAVREDGSLTALPVYLDLATVVTVTNQSLADRIAEEQDFTRDKLRVLPNLIDPALYEPQDRSRNRVPRVMWTGSAYHAADLAILVPVLERLVAETDWEFVFVGSMPDEAKKLPTNRVWQIGGAPIQYYPRLLCDIRADVALAVIAGSVFDRSKSAIKWMECTLSGAAVVATNYGPYAEAIEHDRTGLLVENTTDAWFNAILKAFVHRHRLVAAARDEVIAKHSWQSPEQRAKWVDFFTETLLGQAGS
jgi:SAM-dependent methyltransferase